MPRPSCERGMDRMTPRRCHRKNRLKDDAAWVVALGLFYAGLLAAASLARPLLSALGL